MPLRAVLDGTDLNAWEHDSSTWETLKHTYRDRQLRTVCCDHPAVPKASKLGTFFFAHARRGECTSAPETAEHLLAKSLIARAAREAGWRVTTELRGRTPEGEEWIVDVYAERDTPQRKQRLAFEVQWSGQTLDETVARQERYRRSGVRGLWLMRHREEEPFAHIDYDRDRTPIFGLQPDPPHFTVWPFGVPLADFMRGALGGRLVVWPKGPGPARLGVTTAGLTCWRCKRDTQVIVTVHIAHPKHDKVYFSLSWDEDGIWADGSPVKQLLARLLTPEIRSTLGLGAIKPRFSKTVGGMYLSQGCARCDALQGDYFIMELRHEAFYDGRARAPTLWLPFKLEESLLQAEQEWHFLLAAPSSS